MNQTTKAVVAAAVSKMRSLPAVRPLTGIALATEMTGNVNLLLPVLAACFGAMVVTNLLGIPPIYDLLRERAERKSAKCAQRRRASTGSSLGTY
jgi:H+/Cl- antiporter ClcA